MRGLTRRNAVFLLAIASLARIATADALPAQTSTRSGVTLKVTPRITAGEPWEFDVVLDTHSQELADDLSTTAVLVTPSGESRPLGWHGDPPGGHHRKGVLRFPAPQAAAGAFTLRILRAGEAEARVFRWERR